MLANDDTTKHKTQYIWPKNTRLFYKIHAIIYCTIHDKYIYNTKITKTQRYTNKYEWDYGSVSKVGPTRDLALPDLRRVPMSERLWVCQRS